MANSHPCMVGQVAKIPALSLQGQRPSRSRLYEREEEQIPDWLEKAFPEYLAWLRSDDGALALDEALGLFYAEFPEVYEAGSRTGEGQSSR
jgi:hypothetical protein